MQKMEKIIIEKKGDNFKQIVTLYYINISLSRINSALLQDLKRKKNTKKQEEEELCQPTPKRRNPNSRSLTPHLQSELQYLQAQEVSGWRDEAARRKSMCGPIRMSQKRGKSRVFMVIPGPSAWFLFHGFTQLRGSSRWSWIWVFGSGFLQICAQLLNLMYSLKALQLDLQVMRFNYPKLSLIRLLFQLFLELLIICKIDQNTGEKYHFIHKRVRKCYMKMQNCRLISLAGQARLSSVKS